MQHIQSMGFGQIESLERRQFLSASSFTQHNLVSDGALPADFIDKNLVNPWGIAASATGPLWVANNHSQVATIYAFDTGATAPLVVNVRGADDGKGDPTGQIFNVATHAFRVTEAGKTAASAFIFSGEDGTISAWSPAVDLTNTIVVADNSAKGAIYKGLAQADAHNRTYLYATDFANGHIDVFDSNFHPVATQGRFADSSIPAGYHPFGIQNIGGGKMVVTYAKHVAGDDDEAHGAGFGYAAVFTTSGVLVTNLQHTSLLNAPWGVAVAPKTWHEFAGDLLVGQFGSGNIVAFDPKSGVLKGVLKDAKNHPIVIDGLWGLLFGNTPKTVNQLFFSAGTNDEADGLIGRLSIH